MLPLAARVSWEGPSQTLPRSLHKATPEASLLSGSVCRGGAVSSHPHGNQLPGLVLVWVFLIEVWVPSGVAEVCLLWEPDCGVAMRWGPEVLGPAHRPQTPHARATSHASHHFNDALPLKNILEVSGS